MGIKLSNPKVTTFFRSLVQNTMKDREATGAIRHDMIHLLMEAKKGSLVHESTKDEPEVGFATVQESSIGRQNVKRGSLLIYG
jgi:cytochrome P450 family 9